MDSIVTDPCMESQASLNKGAPSRDAGVAVLPLISSTRIISFKQICIQERSKTVSHNRKNLSSNIQCHDAAVSIICMIQIRYLAVQVRKFSIRALSSRKSRNKHIYYNRAFHFAAYPRNACPGHHLNPADLRLSTEERRELRVCRWEIY